MTPFNDYGRNCDCYGDDGCNGSCQRPTPKQAAMLIAAAIAIGVLIYAIGFCMGKALTAASGVGG